MGSQINSLTAGINKERVGRSRSPNVCLESVGNGRIGHRDVSKGFPSRAGFECSLVLATLDERMGPLLLLLDKVQSPSSVDVSGNGDCNGTVSNLYDGARDCQRGKGEQRNKERGESDHGIVTRAL